MSHIKVQADDTPRLRPTKPLKLYWVMCGTGGDVHSSYVSHRDGDTILFTDGSHQDAQDCHITPEQASRSEIVDKKEQMQRVTQRLKRWAAAMHELRTLFDELEEEDQT